LDDDPTCFIVELEALSDNSSTVRTYKGEMNGIVMTDRLASSEHLELADDMEKVWEKHRTTRRARLMEIFDRRDGLIT
jgi:hypothetical protein